MLGDQTGAQVSAHGSRAGDGVSMIDGLRIGNMYLSSNLTNMSLSPLLFDQVDVQLSGQIGRDRHQRRDHERRSRKSGGNTFSGSVLANGSAPEPAGQQRDGPAAGTAACSGASTTLKKLYDMNGAVGGPIKRDKLWFYATSRYFTNEFYLAGLLLPGRSRRRGPRRGHRSRQAYRRHLYVRQQRPRHLGDHGQAAKISGWYAYQYKVDPHWLINASVSPEAARVTTWHTQLSTTKWTYTATNRLLFEAGIAAGASPDTIKLDPDRPRRHRRSSSRAAAIARAADLSRARPASISTTGCRRSRSTRRRATSPGRTTRNSGSRCSAATSSAATTTTRPAASGTRHARLRAASCHDSGAARRVAEQPELQPRASSRRIVDARSPDASAAAFASTSRTNRPSRSRPRRTAGRRTATIHFAAVEERPELEGHQSARLGRLRSVRQRQDGAQGERQPRRRAGLDPLRAREQPGDDGRTPDAAGLDRQPTIPDCDLTATSARATCWQRRRRRCAGPG